MIKNACQGKHRHVVCTLLSFHRATSSRFRCHTRISNGLRHAKDQATIEATSIKRR